MERERLQIGIDIGSTTTKIVAVNQDTDEITYSDYRRHSAQQVQSVIDCLKTPERAFPGGGTPHGADRFRSEEAGGPAGPVLCAGGGRQFDRDPETVQGGAHSHRAGRPGCQGTVFSVRMIRPAGWMWRT